VHVRSPVKGSPPGASPSEDPETAPVARLDLDDVSLVEIAAPARSTTSGIFELVPLGDSALSAVLLRGGIPVVSELRQVSLSGGDSELRRPLEIGAGQVDAGNSGPSIALQADSRIRFRLEPEAQDGGWATLGTEGFAVRSVDFEAEGVSALLAGEGLELFGLFFDPPVRLSARSDAGAFQISAEITEGGSSLVVRTSFADERVRAGELARQAEQAERNGEPGVALVAWDRLLRQTPFHKELVQRAERSRAVLARQGLEAVRSLAAEYERARFFRLADLFRSTRDSARELVGAYGGSEVGAEAATLLAAVEQDLAGLESRLFEHERRRLQAIQAGLEARGSPATAAAVEDYLAAHASPLPKNSDSPAPEAVGEH
jgi:hypothetical protein